MIYLKRRRGKSPYEYYPKKARAGSMYMVRGRYSQRWNLAGQDVEGLLLWLRADHGIDEADGGSIDNWVSKEGGDYSFDQATADKKPTYHE